MHPLLITGPSCITFSYLDSCALQEATLVCRSWRNSIRSESFLKSYAQSRSTASMSGLIPAFFQRLLPHFHPQQLFHINGERITRHLVHTIPENEENGVNLRVAKLIAGLDWYRSFVQQNVDEYIEQWHYRYPIRTKRFRESIDYIHLFILGNSKFFKRNRADRIDEELLTKYRSMTLMSKSDFKRLSWHLATSNIEEVIACDYESLKSSNPLLLEQAFQTVFSRYAITHIMDPKGDENAFFALPTLLFKSLFSALTAKFVENRSGNVMTSGEGNLKSESESSLGWDTLEISVSDSEQVCSLVHWLATTRVRIRILNLNIGYSRNFTIECWKSFKDNVRQMNVETIQWFGE